METFRTVARQAKGGTGGDLKVEQTALRGSWHTSVGAAQQVSRTGAVSGTLFSDSRYRHGRQVALTLPQMPETTLQKTYNQLIFLAYLALRNRSLATLWSHSPACEARITLPICKGFP